jgi:hypothetical protein
MEEPEVKLEGGELLERDESVAEAERGWLLSAGCEDGESSIDESEVKLGVRGGLLSAGWEDAFLSFLVGIAFGVRLGPSAFRLVVTCLSIMWFSSEAVLERTEV